MRRSPQERDLVAALGKPYADDRRKVPMLIPGLRAAVPASRSRKLDVITSEVA